MTRGGSRPGAGRPRSDDPRRSLTVRIPDGVRAHLEAYAEQEGISLSGGVEDAVRLLKVSQEVAGHD